MWYGRRHRWAVMYLLVLWFALTVGTAALWVVVRT